MQAGLRHPLREDKPEKKDKVRQATPEDKANTEKKHSITDFLCVIAMNIGQNKRGIPVNK